MSQPCCSACHGSYCGRDDVDALENHAWFITNSGHKRPNMTLNSKNNCQRITIGQTSRTQKFRRFMQRKYRKLYRTMIKHVVIGFQGKRWQRSGATPPQCAAAQWGAPLMLEVKILVTKFAQYGIVAASTRACAPTCGAEGKD